jgi:hypothetical protein
MAIPPSRLTMLLYQSKESPEALLDTLQRNGCLSTQGLAGLPKVRALIEQALTQHAQWRSEAIAGAEKQLSLLPPPRPGEPARALRAPEPLGPSSMDTLEQSLLHSPFLSRHGRALSRDR